MLMTMMSVEDSSLMLMKPSFIVSQMQVPDMVIPRFPFSTTVWFMPFTIATLVFVAALAVAAFWRSLGGQSLVGNNPQ